jgi:hypothetical protein
MRGKENEGCLDVTPWSKRGAHPLHLAGFGLRRLVPLELLKLFLLPLSPPRRYPGRHATILLYNRLG